MTLQREGDTVVHHAGSEPPSFGPKMIPLQRAGFERRASKEFHSAVGRVEPLGEDMGPKAATRSVLEGLAKAGPAARLAGSPARLSDSPEPGRLHDMLVRAAELAMEGAPERLRVLLPSPLSEVSGDLAIIQRIVMHIIGRAAGAGGNVEVSAWKLEAGAELARFKKSVVVVRVESVPHDGRRVDPSHAAVEELQVQVGSEVADGDHALLIDYTSAGIGHRFELHLPALETGGASVDHEPPGKRVLVVQSDASLARQMLQMLSYLGAQVDIVSGGIEALGNYERARLAERAYELVILDPLSAGDLSELAGFARILRYDHGVRVAVCANDGDVSGISGYGRRFDMRLPRPFRFADVRRLLA